MALPDDRGRLERASDEIRSWLGDEAAERRREMDERHDHVSRRWRRGEWPNRDDYRYAGETILGRADWGDRESDYEHGFGAFRPQFGPREEVDRMPPGYEGPGVVRRREPLWPNYAGRGPRGYQRSDARIHEDICDRLTADPQVDAFDIEVRVKDAEVTLVGNVRSRQEKRHAEDVASSVTGVKDVMNELRVALL